MKQFLEDRKEDESIEDTLDRIINVVNILANKVVSEHNKHHRDFQTLYDIFEPVLIEYEKNEH